MCYSFYNNVICTWLTMHVCFYLFLFMSLIATGIFCTLIVFKRLDYISRSTHRFLNFIHEDCLLCTAHVLGLPPTCNNPFLIKKEMKCMNLFGAYVSPLQLRRKSAWHKMRLATNWKWGFKKWEYKKKRKEIRWKQEWQFGIDIKVKGEASLMHL